MSVAGIATIVLNFWLYLSLIRSGAAISDMLWISLFYGAGVSIFVGYMVYNRRRGVDVRTLFQEIPPTWLSPPTFFCGGQRLIDTRSRVFAVRVCPNLDPPRS